MSASASSALASAIASSIASRVPEPIEKCAECSGVADQHHVVVRPALVPDPGKIAPDRFVRHQRDGRRACGKHLLADRLRLLDGLVAETVALPGRRVAFDQERAHVRRIAIVMRVEGAEIGRDKRLRQRLERLCGAVPGELVGRMRDRRAELAFEAAAHQRVQPVGRDDQVVAGELIHRLDHGVEPRRDADGADALLQDGQQREPADRGEADAVDLDALAAQIERDVVPALHPGRDRIDRLGIVGAQEFQRLLGEHHAKAPGGAGGVLLEQLDLGVRVTPLPEIGEIEAAGASADHGDAHDLPPN